MHQFVIVNVLIIVLIIFSIVVTQNPLLVFALMFLVQMPVLQMQDDDDGQDDAQPMGFTARL